MKVIAKIIDIETREYSKDGATKKMADITFKSDRDTFTVNMFDRQIDEGKLRLYEALAGQQAVVEINCDIYKGQIQYRLGFTDPRPVAPKAAPSKAA